MKKKRLGTCVLIVGLAVVFFAVVATSALATHTRAGALCVMILKALDLMNAYILASVAVVVGTSTAVFALSRLLSCDAEEDRQKNI